MKIRDLGKNIKEAFNKLINSGEVEEVELTGILANDPEFLEKFRSLDEAGKKPKAKQVSPEQYVEKLKARQDKQKTTSPKVQPNVNSIEKDDDELSL